IEEITTGTDGKQLWHLNAPSIRALLRPYDFAALLEPLSGQKLHPRLTTCLVRIDYGRWSL
ncbi:hypothetical protein ACFVTE_15895, partial [Arthrobacter sp. NPDC058097]|uniref:hypothetical protein n=1 Tax=Arthrobacter sp. NPDC058097 TaxID=3346340 RepID=UPI0036DEC6D8